MVVTVEISGVLEEKLRRLVELGVYSSVAEAVRDAVRNMLERLDLADIAIQLYISRDATFQYTAYFAGKTFHEMIDLMLAREIMPLLGARTSEEIPDTDKNAYIMDPLTAYTIYTSDMYKVLATLKNQGYRFLYPQPAKSQLEVYIARRMLKNSAPTSLPHVIPLPVPTEPPKSLVTSIEESIINYAEAAGIAVLTDDIRTREYASKRRVEAVTSLSLLRKAVSLGLIGFEEAMEIIYTVKAIPMLVPDAILPV